MANAGRLLLAGIAMLVALVEAGEAAVRCRASSDCGSPESLDTVRAAIEMTCPCSSFSKRRAYLKCARRAREAKEAGLPAACRRELRKAIANSTCGHPDRTPCNVTKKRGGTTCQIVPSARCTEKPGKQVACDMFASCMDACNPSGGCASTTTTSSTMSSTTTTTSSTTSTSASISTTMATTTTARTTTTTSSTTTTTTTFSTTTTTTSLPPGLECGDLESDWKINAKGEVHKHTFQSTAGATVDVTLVQTA